MNQNATRNTVNQDSRFLKACRREPVDTTPIWLMRQAGRYMSEYLEVRGRHTILEIIKSAELSCEVTLQPLNAFDLDAGIIFSDILPPLEGMGLGLEFAKGEGPVIHNPIRSEADVDALSVNPAEETMAPTLEAIRLVRREIDSRGIPLIGFSGAPYTLACYAIEGGGSKNYVLTKQMMAAQKQAWRKLMKKMSDVVADYLLAQASAGAQALQLFDTWAGGLSPADYRENVMPYNRAIIEKIRAAGVPIVYFATNVNGMLELIGGLGADVQGVDWRIELSEAWSRFGQDTAVQGNLDPVALFDPWGELEKKAEHVLEQAGGRPGHVFNLGHGILPKTPVDNVKRLVDFVHERGARTK
jgi:uroporphyrinogen decarboxylase